MEIKFFILIIILVEVKLNKFILSPRSIESAFDSFFFFLKWHYGSCVNNYKIRSLFSLGYTQEEKIEIAHRHLIPKQLEQHGLTPQQIQIPQVTTLDIITRLVNRPEASHCLSIKRKKGQFYWQLTATIPFSPPESQQAFP